MTPQKIMRSTTSSHCSDADDVSMKAEESNFSSPPKSTLRRSRTRHAAAAASRLFSDEDDDYEEKETNHSKSKVAVLKPLDLNLELNTNKAVDYNAASVMGRSLKPQSHDSHPHHHPHQRKRHAEQQLQGRDLSFDDEASSPVDMYMSPRISPSAAMLSYKSPASSYQMSSHKSPSSFRTMDGRTVQSKNPFSPMNMEGGTPQPNRARPIADSLTFPVSFEVEGSSSSTNKKENSNKFALPDVPPLLRHRLHKRDSLLDESTARSVSYHYNSFTRDGYPNRTGRYSFTGSPIRENMDIANNSHHHYQDTNNNTASNDDTKSYNKVRRFNKGDDVVAASRNDVHYGKKETDTSNLQVDTSFKSFYGHADEISPTDVLSFPMMSPSTPFAMPPSTPTKQKQQPRHYRDTHASPNRYPPLRRAALPPLTPMIDRSRRTPARSRSFDQDSDRGDNSDGSSQNNNNSQTQIQQAPQSRFYSDFDIIGELGKGSFGCVYKVLSRLDGCMYAVKAAHRPAKGTADKDRMLKEVYALAALSDQADTATFHIVRYHQAWMEENRLYIQTELCTSTLTAELKAGKVATEQRRYKFLREICLALEFIHRNGMVHLDIKPENIFLKNDQFKLGDFGLVSKIAYHNDVEEGDSRYMSMELLSGDHGDLTKSDIFSLGISLYEVCLDGKPLPSDGDAWQALRSASMPTLSNVHVPDEMQRIMRLMMNPSHAQRPTAIDLLKRPQLLSDEQKALMAEKNKVLQANLALIAQERKLRMLTPALPARPRKGLVRANTWNGG